MVAHHVSSGFTAARTLGEVAIQGIHELQNGDAILVLRLDGSPSVGFDGFSSDALLTRPRISVLLCLAWSAWNDERLAFIVRLYQALVKALD